MNAISCTSLCTGVLKNMGRDSNGSPTSFRMIKRYLIDMGSKLGFFLYFFPLEKSDFFPVAAYKPRHIRLKLDYIQETKKSGSILNIEI